MYESKTNGYYPTAPLPTAPAPLIGIPLDETSHYNPQIPLQVDFPRYRDPVAWSTGLFDCTDDCGNCCTTCFCPCITFGRIAEIVDRGSTSCGTSGALYALLECVTCCHWVYSCFYRTKMRDQYSLIQSPCSDWFVHCCCGTCALCQEYRELKNQGFEMTVGWHENMDRRAAGVFNPPAMQAGMMR